MSGVYIPRGLVARVVTALHNDPERWWSSAEIAEECETDSAQVAILTQTPIKHGMIQRKRPPDNVHRWLYAAGTGEPEPAAEQAVASDGLPRQTWVTAGGAVLTSAAVGPKNAPSSPAAKSTNPKDLIGTSRAPLSCVPLPVVAELGVAMLEGAAKYGRHNYRAAGVRASVYMDAALRHLIAWWEGEDIDPDSGLPHVVKAIASLTVLRDAQLQGMCTDDRPPRSRPFYERLNAAAAAILERHAERAPKHYTIDDTKGGE